MRRQDDLSLTGWKLAPHIKSVARSVLDLFFPPQSLDEGPRPLSSGLNATGWASITFIANPVCDGCGVPFEFDLGVGVRCAACMARPRAFDRARAACLYDDASRGPILQLKHADRTDLAPLFARWISRAAHDLIVDAQVIVPVPLHPLRLLSRRYNQSAEIARPLSRISGVAYLPDVLVRTRATESQGGKSGAGRRRNVATAFAVPASRVHKLADRRVLLIDDVMTTGATVEACAMALLRAGASAVDIAVVARVKEMANQPI